MSSDEDVEELYQEFLNAKYVNMKTEQEKIINANLVSKMVFYDTGKKIIGKKVMEENNRSMY